MKKRLILLASAFLVFTGAHNVKKNQYRFRVPILCYHNISDKVNGRFTITPEVFEKHMKYLFTHNYNVIPLEKLVKFLRYLKQKNKGKVFLPRNPIVITFDDNYPSIYKDALPILNKFKFKSVNFIYTKYMTKNNWKIYRKITKSSMVLESHTLNHVNLTKKRNKEDIKAFYKRIYKEIRDSREILMKKLKKNIKYLAYPYGVCNGMVKRFARLAGYSAMFSALGGYVNEKTKLDEIPRFTVFNNFDMKMFKKIVSGNWYGGLKTYKRGKCDFEIRDYNFDF